MSYLPAFLADSAFPVPCIRADRPAGGVGEGVPLVFITILIVDILGQVN